ncbi:hypothetical protein [Xanthobacter flavus]|uniref:hypothetical protein n=1 Tax=Xanthobacter flavus TaxID=281 RepID=UPI0037275067
MIVMDTATAFGVGAVLLILGSLLGSAWSLRRLDAERLECWEEGFATRFHHDRQMPPPRPPRHG